MANLSEAQLISLAQMAGFTGENDNIAAAVALAESGGNPKAHNSTPPDDSYGLWQINMLGSMGPARRKKYHLKSNTDLYDPATNARVAYGIYKDSGWKAWTTYTSGKYKDKMSATTGEVPGKIADGAADVAEAVNPANAITGGFNALSESFTKATSNVGGIILAIALILVGALFLLRNVIPAGRALKTVNKLAGAAK